MIHNDLPPQSRVLRNARRRMEKHLEDIERERQQARAELRDRFAMAALTGLLAEGSHPRLLCAEEAYFHADAMLKARGDD